MSTHTSAEPPARKHPNVSQFAALLPSQLHCNPFVVLETSLPNSSLPVGTTVPPAHASVMPTRTQRNTNMSSREGEQGRGGAGHIARSLLPTPVNTKPPVST
ncbi:hypothetical protein FHG87_005154 [Trinorchestia longiramus]|nr:hypothetical protein FHG87_005154 [Trinorchestia longiramus]